MADELEPTDAEATAVEEEVVVEAPKPTAKKKSSSVVEEEAVVVEEPVAVIEEPVNPGGIYEETGLTEAEVKAQAVIPTAQPVAPVTSMIAFSSRKR
jgi:hypothetical protein